ncbi:hypothetical protein [Vibrio harveyi]|uniref:hypothetical protein n=1 Tax=Vibrio harveyi TaxID=669 RepID=UPI0024815DA6|nr:hypothetical protein [Vibrio harveyi]
MVFESNPLEYNVVARNLNHGLVQYLGKEELAPEVMLISVEAGMKATMSLSHRKTLNELVQAASRIDDTYLAAQKRSSTVFSVRYGQVEAKTINQLISLATKLMVVFPKASSSVMGIPAVALLHDLLMNGEYWESRLASKKELKDCLDVYLRGSDAYVRMSLKDLGRSKPKP